jgi:hypothetical protein
MQAREQAGPQIWGEGKKIFHYRQSKACCPTPQTNRKTLLGRSFGWTCGEAEWSYEPSFPSTKVKTAEIGEERKPSQPHVLTDTTHGQLFRSFYLF